MPLLEKHQGLSRQISHGNLSLPAKGMAFAASEYELVLEQHLRCELPGIEWQRNQGQVKLTKSQTVEQWLSELLIEDQSQGRITCSQAMQDAWQQERTNRGDNAKPDVARERSSVGGGEAHDVLGLSLIHISEPTRPY